MLRWQPLPDLPDELGVAGPIVGTHNGGLIVAGGANFPRPVWDHPKRWTDDAWVLVKGAGGRPEWIAGLKLDRPRAYAACATTSRGIVCIGGNDAERTFADCFLLGWDPQNRGLTRTPLPDLPQPSVYGAAAAIGDVVYLAAGQTSAALESASAAFYRLDLSAPSPAWQALPACPGPACAFALLAAQHNGFDTCLYLIGGRRQKPGVGGVAGIEPLADVHEFNPRLGAWRQRTSAPRAIMAGAAAPVGQSHLFILSGDDGALMARTDELRLDHPGFARNVLAWHAITDTWIDAGPSPANQVTTPAARWEGKLVLVSGEVKPRVRTPAAWIIEPVSATPTFGALNMTVLVVYLLAMVGVGAWFARRNRDTDDYFRGGKRMIWWAAACSIFATMLSSITYMAIPAKAYAQDLVYLVANLMIPVVAPIAVFIALPFFRRIDATSAYEYLEKRFNRPVRLFASASFTLFHIFRMGIVMSLAGLALAAFTPLSPAQSVLLMGVLSVIYCTLGGVEAVIWTDTIQTFVLLGGALLCFVLAVIGAGGLSASFSTALADGKLHLANWHLNPASASVALWVVILGGIGQNISSYTADQAIVQRYMTTPDERRAARSIWTATLMAIPSSLLFYFMGTALYAYYKANPAKLDPTFMTDQILPLFIAHEAPAGVAGLIVAGIFAAAQSTISTSMNSTATTVVTDFLRPFNALRSERAYLNCARGLTLGFGILGTLLALAFIDGRVRSLFDQFILVIGLFMGVLGGLFALGMLTRRASGWAALGGALAGAAIMGLMPVFTRVHGLLYAPLGIAVCFAVGYALSLLLPARPGSAEGLTIHALRRAAPQPAQVR